MKTWDYIDKKTWSEGPWQQEHDKMLWTDEDTGYPCIIRRNASGVLCGYVGVPTNHSWFGIHYGDFTHRKCQEEYCYDENCCQKPDRIIDVHGGLTFSNACSEDEEYGICHPSNQEAWWFGFDCAHLGDLMPAYQNTYSNMSWARRDGTYKNAEYVKSEIKSMALQLKKYEGKES